MMSELLIEGLLPELATKAREHRARAHAVGIEIVFTSGYRTPAQQEDEYAKGRQRDPFDGSWHLVDASKVVTHALPEHAPHCRGAAYDLVPIVNGKAAWDRLDLFAKLGGIGKELALVWGGDWLKLKDLPHFELPNWRALPLR